MDTRAKPHSSSSEEGSILGTTKPTTTTGLTGTKDKDKQKITSDSSHRAGLQSHIDSKAPKHLSSKASKAAPTQQVSVSSIKATIPSIKSAASDTGSLTESIGGTAEGETSHKSDGKRRPPADYSKLYQYILATSRTPLGTNWSPPDLVKAPGESARTDKPLPRPERADTSMSLSSQPPDRLDKSARPTSLSGSRHGSTDSIPAAIAAEKPQSSRSRIDVMPTQRSSSNGHSRTSSQTPGVAPGNLPSHANTRTLTQSPGPYDELYDCTPPEEYGDKDRTSSKSKGSNVNQNARGGKRDRGRGGNGGAPRGSGVH